MGVRLFINNGRADLKALRVCTPIELSHKSWFFAVLLIRARLPAKRDTLWGGPVAHYFRDVMSRCCSWACLGVGRWSILSSKVCLPVNCQTAGSGLCQSPNHFIFIRGQVESAELPLLSASPSVIAIYFAMLKSKQGLFLWTISWKPQAPLCLSVCVWHCKENSCS